MQKGITSAEFFGSLSKKLPTTLANLMQRAKKYTRQDDAMMISRFLRSPEKRI